MKPKKSSTNWNISACPASKITRQRDRTAETSCLKQEKYSTNCNISTCQWDRKSRNFILKTKEISYKLKHFCLSCIQNHSSRRYMKSGILCATLIWWTMWFMCIL